MTIQLWNRKVQHQKRRQSRLLLAVLHVAEATGRGKPEAARVTAVEEEASRDPGVRFHFEAVDSGVTGGECIFTSKSSEATNRFF